MEKPTGILIISVVYTIVGLYWIISAAWSTLLVSSFGGMFGGFMLALGALSFIFSIVFGMIHLAIASALVSGKNWARIFTIILASILFVLEAISLFSGGISAILFIILNFAVIYYLKRPHIVRYFKGIENS